MKEYNIIVEGEFTDEMAGKIKSLIVDNFLKNKSEAEQQKYADELKKEGFI